MIFVSTLNGCKASFRHMKSEMKASLRCKSVSLYIGLSSPPTIWVTHIVWQCSKTQEPLLAWSDGKNIPGIAKTKATHTKCYCTIWDQPPHRDGMQRFTRWHTHSHTHPPLKCQQWLWQLLIALGGARRQRRCCSSNGTSGVQTAWSFPEHFWISWGGVSARRRIFIPLLLCLTQSCSTACHFFCSFSVVTQK